MFSLPEEKLWLVVKHYNGAIEQSPTQQFDGKKGIKLEKNCVIKMGRVRLRVRDIDYADEVKPIKPILSSPPKDQINTPGKKTSSATKLKGSQANNQSAGNQEEFDNIGGPIDLNEIKLIEEAQSRAAAMVQGRTFDQDAFDKKKQRSA